MAKPNFLKDALQYYQDEIRENWPAIVITGTLFVGFFIFVYWHDNIYVPKKHGIDTRWSKPEEKTIAKQPAKNIPLPLFRVENRSVEPSGKALLYHYMEVLKCKAIYKDSGFTSTVYVDPKTMAAEGESYPNCYVRYFYQSETARVQHLPDAIFIFPPGDEPKGESLGIFNRTSFDGETMVFQHNESDKTIVIPMIYLNFLPDYHGQ